MNNMNITKNFKVEEFFKDDVKLDVEKINFDFVDMLQRARNISSRMAGYDIKYTVSSGVRSNSENHKYGKGVDIKAKNSRDRFFILLGCIEVFNRIGIYDKHIHVDMNEKADKNVLWTGKSR